MDLANLQIMSLFELIIPLFLHFYFHILDDSHHRIRQDLTYLALSWIYIWYYWPRSPYSLEGRLQDGNQNDTS